MSKVDDLIRAYRNHIVLPWNDILAPQEKVWFCIYDPAQERRIRKQMEEFAIVTQETGHDWIPIDITNFYEEWLSTNEYREKYFKNPKNLKFEENNFLNYLSDYVLSKTEGSTKTSIIAIIGVGSFYGITRVSKIVEHIIKKVPIPGRLLVFFPGEREGNNYRLLKAKDGWNYLATPIEAEEIE